MESSISFAPEHNSTGTALWYHPDSDLIAFAWRTAVQLESHHLGTKYEYRVCLGRVFPRLVMDCLEMFVVQTLPGY